MTNYAKGATYEREFCKRMEAKGYLAIRSAGSHGMVDVILLPLKNAQPIFPCPNTFLGALTTPHIGIFVCQLKRGRMCGVVEKKAFASVEFATTVWKLWVSKKDRESEVIELL